MTRDDPPLPRPTFPSLTSRLVVTRPPFCVALLAPCFRMQYSTVCLHLASFRDDGVFDFTAEPKLCGRCARLFLPGRRSRSGWSSRAQASSTSLQRVPRPLASAHASRTPRTTLAQLSLHRLELWTTSIRFWRPHGHWTRRRTEQRRIWRCWRRSSPKQIRGTPSHSSVSPAVWGNRQREDSC